MEARDEFGNHAYEKCLDTTGSAKILSVPPSLMSGGEGECRRHKKAEPNRIQPPLEEESREDGDEIAINVYRKGVNDRTHRLKVESERAKRALSSRC